MVKGGFDFNNLIQKKDFRDHKDIDALIEICKAYPNFKLPYLLLLNYQPDFFNHDFWTKGEEFVLQSKSNLRSYFRDEVKNDKATDELFKKDLGLKELDQKNILKSYLSKEIPKFI